MKTENMRNVFDIETGGLPEAEIGHLAPAFAAPGNYKDPEKIAANIAEQRAKWLERAALSPITGRILAIGVKPAGRNPIFLEAATPDEEPNLIAGFWQMIGERDYQRFMGWNIEGFDLPFIVKRSWKHRIPVPMGLVMSGRFLGPRFVDLMKTFQAPNYREDFTSLGTAAKFLGIGEKNGEGAHFAETYAKDRDAALAYLANDLALTEGLADVLSPAVDSGDLARIA
jgi:hypothetical protein